MSFLATHALALLRLVLPHAAVLLFFLLLSPLASSAQNEHAQKDSTRGLFIDQKVEFYAMPSRVIPVGHGVDGISLIEVSYQKEPCIFGEGALINVLYEQVAEPGWNLMQFIETGEKVIIKVVVTVKSDNGMAKKLGTYPYVYWLDIFLPIDSEPYSEEELLRRLESTQRMAKDLGE